VLLTIDCCSQIQNLSQNCVLLILVMEGCLVREANGITFLKSSSSEEREPFIAILSILYPTISGTQLLVTAGFGSVFSSVLIYCTLII